MTTSNQRYISNELTHFVGRGKKTDEQYRLLVKIVNEGWLSHPPHNPNIVGNVMVNSEARISQNEMYNPQVVCFCDIPISELGIHMEKYNPFGLSFSKDFIVSAGGCPVFYIPQKSKVETNNEFPPDFYEKWERMLKIEDTKQLFDENTRGSYFDWIIKEYSRFMIDNLKSNLQNMEIFRFLEFQIFSFIKFFDHKLIDEDINNYYFEREWRIVGNLKFNISDIKRIILVEGYGKKFRNDCSEYCGQITFS